MRKLIMILASLFFLGASTYLAKAQPTPASQRIESYQKRKQLYQNSIVSQVGFRSAGPTVFSGRIVDLAVNPKDPTHFYAAYASGGLWKTTNNGTTFLPLFDDEIVMSIGDIAADWDRNIIWIGTGENNSSRSSYAGVGMFKSVDGGKNWLHMGLDDSHHISRIILHPDNPEILWVASLGHLYSANKERGIYKTIDGGKTWKQVLFVNENAGGVDLVLDPNNTNTLYAATWERTRRSWDFTESGAGSGIYKSIDGGENWSLISTAQSGFPTGEGVGRIGLDITIQDGQPLLYAILDNYNRRPAKASKPQDGLSKSELRNMDRSAFLALEKQKIKGYLSANRFPKKYTVEKVISMVNRDEIKPSALVDFTEDANSLLFDTPVIGAEVYRSSDNGKTWSKQNKDYLDQVYNSYGYYFGQIRVADQDPDKIYILGVPVLKSLDGGASWESIGGSNVHSDHHALWVNPDRDEHLILGNDGGVNISYDDGKKWIKCNSPAVGQFYYIAVDMAEPYNIYGGLQDNGVWVGPSSYQASDRWHSSGQYPYKSLLGGDGMQVQVDTRDNNTVYAGFQFGFYFRINKKTGRRKMIKPQHELGERPLRFNWQSPIHLSKHNQDIVYFGANKLYRSLNQGDDYEAISDDLTNGGKKGDVPFGTLSTIHESDLQFGLLYTGSDDGQIHVSHDGGVDWTNIASSLPQNLWVSRIQASSHKKSRVYVTLNGYRDDNFNCYVFRSEDYGHSWKRIGEDLPKEPANVIKEDPENENLLYVGTDHGLYISLDGGHQFMQMKNGLPATPVHDIVIHPRDHDLLVGTHGRSIFKANIEALQQLDEELLAATIHAFPTNGLRYNSNWGNRRVSWRAPSEPSIQLPFYSNSEGKATILIKTGKDIILKRLNIQAKKGLNYIPYNLSVDAEKVATFESWLNKTKENKGKEVKLKKADNKQYYLTKGKYIFEVKKDGKDSNTKFEIK